MSEKKLRIKIEDLPGTSEPPVTEDEMRKVKGGFEDPVFSERSDSLDDSVFVGPGGKSVSGDLSSGSSGDPILGND